MLIIQISFAENLPKRPTSENKIRERSLVRNEMANASSIQTANAREENPSFNTLMLRHHNKYDIYGYHINTSIFIPYNIDIYIHIYK